MPAPPEIAEGVGAVVLEMRNDFPNAKILLLAIFPRSTPGDPVRDKIAEVNRIISKLDDQRHVFYLDIGPKFLDEKGYFLPDSFRTDNLHPQAKGYDIWGSAVQDKSAGADEIAVFCKSWGRLPPIVGGIIRSGVYQPCGSVSVSFSPCASPRPFVARFEVSGVW